MNMITSLFLAAVGQTKQCTVPGCTEPYCASGLCRRHYNTARYRRRHGITTPLGELTPYTPPAETRCTVTCTTTGCPNQAAGPWRIIGWQKDDTYQCSRCHQPMTVTPGWADEGDDVA